MSGDAPRFLHRSSAHGYTSDLSRALFAEPEAISLDDQEQYSAQAERRRHEAQVAQWRETRAAMERELAWLYSQRLRRDVRRQLRSLTWQLDQLDRRITGQT